MMHENGQAEDYLSEYMQEVYSGVFFKEFVLFFGENLQYYIMEESENEEQLTESGSLQKSDIMNESPDSKYEIINDMMISMTLQDDTTLDRGILPQGISGSQIVHIAVKIKKDSRRGGGRTCDCREVIKL
jgi:hypothetical protein